MIDSIIEIDKFGTKFFKNSKGQLYREDGPAIIWKNGGKYWFINDKHHRIDGPACIYGVLKYWYLNNKNIRKFQYD